MERIRVDTVFLPYFCAFNSRRRRINRINWALGC